MRSEMRECIYCMCKGKSFFIKFASIVYVCLVQSCTKSQSKIHFILWVSVKIKFGGHIQKGVGQETYKLNTYTSNVAEMIFAKI